MSHSFVSCCSQSSPVFYIGSLHPWYLGFGDFKIRAICQGRRAQSHTPWPQSEAQRTLLARVTPHNWWQQGSHKAGAAASLQVGWKVSPTQKWEKSNYLPSILFLFICWGGKGDRAMMMQPSHQLHSYQRPLIRGVWHRVMRVFQHKGFPRKGTDLPGKPHRRHPGTAGALAQSYTNNFTNKQHESISPNPPPCSNPASRETSFSPWLANHAEQWPEAGEWWEGRRGLVMGGGPDRGRSWGHPAPSGRDEPPAPLRGV